MGNKRNKKDRVILFLDVDSFSIQILIKDHPQFKDQPCVVLNDKKLASISYEAKTLGITRKNTLEEAKAICPELQIFEVDLESEDLDPFESSRLATWNIGKVVEDYVVSTLGLSENEVEVASQDEVYVDITKTAIARIDQNASFSGVPDFEFDNSVVPHMYWESEEGCSRLTPLSFAGQDFQTKLYLQGGVIAQELCQLLEQDVRTQFKCSAGIAHNKLVAKVGCGLHRPNAVTILTPGSTDRVSSLIKVESIPGLGGRGGKLLKEKFEVSFVRDLQSISEEAMKEALGESLTERIRKLANWTDESAVVPKKLGSELVCRRKYEDEDDLTPQSYNEIVRSTRLVSKRMALRLTEEKERHLRTPLNLKFGMKPGKVVELEFAINNQNLDDLTWDTIYEAAFRKLGDVYDRSKSEHIKEISLTVKRFSNINS